MTFRTSVPRAIERKGHQAANLMAALTDPLEASMQSPRTDKPVAVIETARFPKGNSLEAKDHALYELLYAYARFKGLDREEHEIAATDMQRYLGVGDLRRIAASINRIRSARMSYDFVDPGREVRRKEEIPLILVKTTARLTTRASSLIYSIPPAICRYVAASRKWFWLEITAFAKFKSKYTSPLYQRLTLVGGPYKTNAETWTVTPEELATIVGYCPGSDNFAFGVFNRDVLQPALSDIERHITRFRVSIDLARRSTKGRRVEGIAFTVTARSKPLAEIQATHLSVRGMWAARQDDLVHHRCEMPSTLLIGQAVTATGMQDVELIEGWKAALDRAKADPDAQLVDGMQGELLLYTLEEDGVGMAFRFWLDAVHDSGQRLDTQRCPIVKENSGNDAGQNQTVRKMGCPTVEDIIGEPAGIGVSAAGRGDEAMAARLQRHKEYAQDEASRILTKLAGKCPFTGKARTWDDAHFLVYCDGEISPWNTVVSHLCELNARNLQNGVRTLQKTNSATLRKTLRTLGKAIVDWDLDKLNKVSRAIYAADKNRTLPEGNMQPFPDIARARNFSATREVTEMSVEYDFADPAYAAAVSWNDVDFPEMEGASAAGGAT